MANFMWYVFLIAVLALVAAGAVFVVRSYMAGTSPRAALFGPKPPPRLAVVDYANVDGRRRLVLVRRDDVRQETVGIPGAEDPTTVVLRQQRGLMRARQADTVTAALVGACDGDLTVGQILHAVADLLDRDPAELRDTYLPVAQELVEEGFLTR